MELVYTHKKSGRQIFSRVKIPKPKGEFKGYLYFLKLVNPETEEILYKIGTTDNPHRRMKEHLRGYGLKVDVYILWISPCYSKYTTLRIEDRQKKWWREFCLDWEYLPNDRFRIPSYVTEICVTVKRDYIVTI